MNNAYFSLKVDLCLLRAKRCSLEGFAIRPLIAVRVTGEAVVFGFCLTALFRAQPPIRPSSPDYGNSYLNLCQNHLTCCTAELGITVAH